MSDVVAIATSATDAEAASAACAKGTRIINLGSIEPANGRALAAAGAKFGSEIPLSNQIAAGFRDLVEVHDGADLDHSAYFLWLKQRQKAELRR